MSTQKVCSVKCAIIQGKLDAEIKAKKKQKAEDKKHLARKTEFNDKDGKLQKKLAQIEFNRWIRWRDRKKGCVSCDKDKDWWGQWQAGHYKTVGARCDLRFNEDNCHKQCSKCNNHLSANLIPYRVELIERIGLPRVEALDVHGPPQNLRAADYIEVKLDYRRRLKDEQSDCQ